MKLLPWFLCALVAAAPAVAADAGSFKIALQATPEAVPYDLQGIEKTAEHREGAAPDWTVNETKQLVMKQTGNAGDGSLAVKCTVVGETAFDSRAKVHPDPAEFQPYTYEYQISPRGARLLDPPSTDPAVLLSPVFPQEAISPGFKWTTDAKIVELGDLPLKVQHEFLQVQTLQGRPCAIIVSEVEAKDKVPSGKAGAVFRGAMRTAISLADGIVIHSAANSSLTIKAVMNDKGESFLNRRETVRLLQRREDL